MCLECYKGFESVDKEIIFLNLTFELGGNIRKQTKTHLCRWGCLFWLCSMCSSRTNDYVDFIELGEEVKKFLNKYMYNHIPV